MDTENAIAAQAASGASFITWRMIQNTARWVTSMTLISGAALSPTVATPQPNSTEKTTTCRMFPSANAPTALVGTRLSMKSPRFSDLAALTLDPPLSVAGLMCRPAPGRSTFTTTRPMTSASVVMTSK